MDNDSALAQVRAAPDAGLSDQSLNIAKERQKREVVNADLRLVSAHVLEELALVDEVIFELNFGLRDDPERPSIYTGIPTRRLTRIMDLLGQSTILTTIEAKV